MKSTAMLLWLAAFGLAVTIACTSDASKPDEPDDDERKERRAVSAETLSKGRALYKSTCAPCHGDGGKGDGPAGKIFKPPPQDHTNPAYMDTLTDEDMTKTIQMGGALKGKPSMPSNPQIKGDDMKALLAFVRSLSHPVK